MNRSAGTLGKRFAVLQWVLTFVVLLPVVLFTFLQLDGNARESLRHDVSIRSRSLLTIYRTGGSPAVARSIDERLTGYQDSDKAYLLIDAHGKKLAGNVAEWPAGAPASADQVTTKILRDGSAKPEQARMKTFRLPTGERLLVGSVALARTETQYTIIGAALSAILLMIPVVPIVSRLQERFLKRRISEMSEAASAFAAGDLSRRIKPYPESDECSELAVALNRTFDRLQVLVEDLIFVTDALAHELRSPVMRLQAEFEKLESPNPQERAGSLDRMSVEIASMLRTIDATLELSKAEAEGVFTFERVNVGRIMRDLWEVFEPSAEQQSTMLTISRCDECECVGNGDLLAQAVSNLLDNALKHSHASRIEFGCAREGSGCTLTVADDGIGIREEDRSEAIRKFGRLDAARTSHGTGLGLAFVKVIAALHGGEFLLEDNRPGLRAIIRLPTA